MKSSNKVKRGVINGRQRYTCKRLLVIIILLFKNPFKTGFIKRKALQLYLEGLDFRSIGHIYEISHVSVYNWIKSFGSKLHPIRSDTEIEVIEMDEMHSYIGNKKTTVGYGLLLIDMGKIHPFRYWRSIIGNWKTTMGEASKTKM